MPCVVVAPPGYTNSESAPTLAVLPSFAPSPPVNSYMTSSVTAHSVPPLDTCFGNCSSKYIRLYSCNLYVSENCDRVVHHHHHHQQQQHAKMSQLGFASPIRVSPSTPSLAPPRYGSRVHDMGTSWRKRLTVRNLILHVLLERLGILYHLPILFFSLYINRLDNKPRVYPSN